MEAFGQALLGQLHQLPDEHHTEPHAQGRGAESAHTRSPRTRETEPRECVRVRQVGPPVYLQDGQETLEKRNMRCSCRCDLRGRAERKCCEV